MTDDALDQQEQSDRDSQIGQHTLMATLDTHKRRRGVRVTAGAVAAALALALGGGLLADGAVAGAATSAPTASGTGHPPTGSAVGPGKVGPWQRAPGGLPPGGKPPAAIGTVKSVASDSFTLSTANGETVSVDVTSSTAYRDEGVTSPTLSDVKAGKHVLVMGTSESGVVTATTVLIGEPPSRSGAGGPPPLHGTSGGPPKSGSPANGWSAPANNQS